jgi:EF-P beta-lysylation protein EpmB
VLLVVAGVCAINCRYCFRRHFPYDTAPRTKEQLAGAFEYLRNHPEVDEVLLSGGDPLMLSDDRLGWIVEQLDSIPNLRRLRIHTRMPVAIPQRVTARLIEILGSSRLQIITVIHANHPNEIDERVGAALKSLKVDGDSLLLNQSVLLRGVNDSVEVLEQLSRRLIDCSVLPYYLHQLDLVAGAAHFEVAPETGRSLIAELRDRLPGYMVPAYVQELPGRNSKTPLT